MPPPDVDGRRVERFFQELRRDAPHYTPELDVSDTQSAGAALMRIFAQLAEAVAVRLDRAPQKHFVAFLDRLGIVPLPARAARAAIAFQLAPGLETAVRVPAGTRVTAPGPDDEIPFETTGDLVAIPGTIAAVYSVDPARDVIYLPPPGFLAQKPRTATALVYVVQSFAAADSKRLQLDHVTGLEPDAYVRIGGNEQRIVDKVENGSNIVTLTAPHGRDIDEGTELTPIRDFAVFAGIDRQEHVLFVGHSGVLTIKEEAEITLSVTLAKGGAAPLRLAWQFWTQQEPPGPDDEAHWHELTLDTDGTAGLTRSGEIVLIKPDLLEIKAVKVSGVESRWIRAQLLDKLTAAPDTLPQIDSLALAVRSLANGGAGIAADQGFYNATPLDVQIAEHIGFFPFGAEPRQFDQFYVASKEAFSKPGAAIELDFTLDPQTLAAPSVVGSAEGLRVYSIGLWRRLYELSMKTSRWRSLGSPADIGSSFLPVEDSVPSALASADGDQLYVFAIGADATAGQDPPSRVWVHCHPSAENAAGHWVDLEAPGEQAATRLRFSPAAARVVNGGLEFARVFVVGRDDTLYSQAISNLGSRAGGWTSHGQPSNASISSPPFVIADGPRTLFVFLTSGGIVHRLTTRVPNPGTWTPLTPSDATAFTAISTPFAHATANQQARVFVVGLERGTGLLALFECDTAAASPDGLFEWKNLGWPSITRGTTALAPGAHAPCAFVEHPAADMKKEGRHVFVRGSDGQLYERLDDTKSGKARWTSHARPGEPVLRDSPALQIDKVDATTTLSVFAATGQNSILTWTFVEHDGRELRARFDEETPSQTEHKLSDDATIVPELSWEYWNGRGWLSLTADKDGTLDLLKDGTVSFSDVPAIQPTEVAGQHNFWIRARLAGGDYGRETFRLDPDSNKIISEKNSLRPPKVARLRIRYAVQAAPPEACVAFNNLDYLDQTAAAQLTGAHFPAFEPLDPRNAPTRTVFYGFDHAFRAGPVGLLLDAAERETDPGHPPAFDWRFTKDHRWIELLAEDGSAALTRPGILALSAPETLTLERQFGRALYWIKASIPIDRANDPAYANPLLRGLFLNTVEAGQGETITGEIVGSGDGEAGQRHALQHGDVLAGEDIRVQETLSVEEREQIERDQGEDSVATPVDLAGLWVRWRETAALFDAGPRDRRYTIDRAAGRLQFGDGQHGAIPPAGVDNIRAFRYRTGGGAAGNLDAGKIATLATAVEGVAAVFNPTPSGGGSDKASTEAMLTIGPREISSRDRAVAPEDFEALACAASRQVARARCLAVTNLASTNAALPDPCDPAQQREARSARGWVSVIVVPDAPDSDPRPCPSLELRCTVRDYLEARAPTTLVSGQRLIVSPPDYVTVAIDADLFVTSLELAAAVEGAAQTALAKLLHPLRGGPEGQGWEFGRSISRSDVFAVLESIAAVDRVENLQFRAGGRLSAERVDIAPHELLASGSHDLRIRKA
jgi:hypothetical protein